MMTRLVEPTETRQTEISAAVIGRSLLGAAMTVQLRRDMSAGGKAHFRGRQFTFAGVLVWR